MQEEGERQGEVKIIPLSDEYLRNYDNVKWADREVPLDRGEYEEVVYGSDTETGRMTFKWKKKT